MMNEPIDLLQVKIEKAKESLPETTRRAIEAVDWRGALLQIKDKYRFSVEQLGDLELETELLLCGLLASVNYPKELKTRMGLSESEAETLAREMNELVFKKIREKLIEITEKKEAQIGRASSPLGSKPENVLKPDTPASVSPAEIHSTLKSAGIEIAPEPTRAIEEFPAELPNGNRDEMLKKIEHPELIKKTSLHPITEQKLSGSFQIPKKETEHPLPQVLKPTPTVDKRADPYREIPE